MYRAIRADEELPWNMYPLSVEIADHCRAHGYSLFNCDASRTGRLFLSITHDRDTFLPDISYTHHRNQPSEFGIQTSGYGILKSAEYETFLQCCTEAYDLVTELEEVIERIGVVPGETVALYQEY